MTLASTRGCWGAAQTEVAVKLYQYADVPPSLALVKEALRLLPLEQVNHCSSSHVKHALVTTAIPPRYTHSAATGHPHDTLLLRLDVGQASYSCAVSALVTAPSTSKKQLARLGPAIHQRAPVHVHGLDTSITQHVYYRYRKIPSLGSPFYQQH